jgi:hypothetical protein
MSAPVEAGVVAMFSVAVAGLKPVTFTGDVDPKLRVGKF